MFRRSVGCVLFLSLFVISAQADIAPDPGFTRAYSNIVLDPRDDFADFRFFINSGDILKEVAIKKGEKNVLKSVGGGARYRSATIFAIPKKSLTTFGANLDDTSLKGLLSAIEEKKVSGIVTLFDHSFVKDVRTAEARNVTDTTYRLEKTKDGSVSATAEKSSARIESNQELPSFASANTLGAAGWLMIASGCIATLALIVLGVWIARRKANRV
jgi:hypothetical protein